MKNFFEVVNFTRETTYTSEYEKALLAATQAWPEGLFHFKGMDKEMIRAELEHAYRAFPTKESVGGLEALSEAISLVAGYSLWSKKLHGCSYYYNCNYNYCNYYYCYYYYHYYYYYNYNYNYYYHGTPWEYLVFHHEQTLGRELNDISHSLP